MSAYRAQRVGTSGKRDEARMAAARIEALESQVFLVYPREAGPTCVGAGIGLPRTVDGLLTFTPRLITRVTAKSRD